MLLQTKLAETIPHVLLVEDDILVNKIHRKKLEILGCTVDSVVNGTDALATLYNNYDLILLDLGLPDISGLEVCKQIRKYEEQQQLPRIPIVLITAYPETTEMQQACVAAGIDKIINKPIVNDSTWVSLLGNYCFYNC